MSTHVVPDPSESSLPPPADPPQSLSIGAGFSWIAEGWRLFTQAPLIWVVLVVLLLVMAIAMAFVPFLGNIAWQILTPVFGGGLVLGCAALEDGGELEIEHLFAGFKANFASLALLGVLYLGGVVVALLVFAIFAGFSMLPALIAGDSENALGAITAMGGGLLAGTLVFTVLSLLLGAAMWFAPALVVRHGLGPIEAMKASIGGTFRNVLGVLVYLVVMFVLAILAVIPFGLGMLVWLPLLVTSSYCAYRQIFTA